MGAPTTLFPNLLPCLSQPSIFVRSKGEKFRKTPSKIRFLHHKPLQNITLLPFPIEKRDLFFITSLSFLKAFHTTTPYPSFTPLKNRLPSSSPNFPIMICFHKDPLSIANPQFYLPRNALFNTKRLRISESLSFFPKQTMVQLTK